MILGEFIDEEELEGKTVLKVFPSDGGIIYSDVPILFTDMTWTNMTHGSGWYGEDRHVAFEEDQCAKKRIQDWIDSEKSKRDTDAAAKEE